MVEKLADVELKSSKLIEIKKDGMLPNQASITAYYWDLYPSGLKDMGLVGPGKTSLEEFQGGWRKIGVL